jgi:hypothetical protein
MFFDDEEDKAEWETWVQDSIEFLDSLNNPLKAQIYFFICALIDLFLLSAAFFFTRYIKNLSFETNFLFYLFLFVAGFVMANAAWRLVFPTGKWQTNSDPEAMPSHKYLSPEDSMLIIWLVSTLAGALNMLIALYISKLT